MDRKIKLILLTVLSVCFIATVVNSAQAQEVANIQFCDKEYGDESDSLTLFLKVRDGNNKMVDILSDGQINYLKILEDGNEVSDGKTRLGTTEKRIPYDMTFSVLIDLGIKKEKKEQICKAIESLVKSAGDSCVFLSYFGDFVGRSTPATSTNYWGCCEDIIKMEPKGRRCFYSALYAKITEFDSLCPPLANDILVNEPNYCDYIKDAANIYMRANKNDSEKNIVFFFTESTYEPLAEEEITLPEIVSVMNKQGGYKNYVVPKVYSFVYTPDSTKLDEDLVNILSSFGRYTPSNDFDRLIRNFEETVDNEKSDYAFTYQVQKVYDGTPVNYTAIWKKNEVGAGTITIGTKLNKWPVRDQSTGALIKNYLIALLVSLLAILFYILVMKVVIPGIKSLIFKAKYYKKYDKVLEESYKKYCKQGEAVECCRCTKTIKYGEPVVARCKHIMHVDCWKEGGRHCGEYGQNCKEGIQEHVDWKEVLSIHTLRSSYQTIAGVCAGLVGWIIFNLLGNGAFESLSRSIVNAFYHKQNGLVPECVRDVSSFLTMGLLLAFFLSLVFRYFDGVQKKDWNVWLRITGWSLLSGIIGLASFALGGIILCLLLSIQNSEKYMWLCSMPAFLLFSVCTSLSLTIKSSIPTKSALLGGLASAIIGFMVLYFSKFTGKGFEWMNVLLDFVIYGGGLGASIVTARKLSEKYFLVVKAGVITRDPIAIHKWMSASGGNKKVTIGKDRRCEIPMTWDNSDKVVEKHAQLYVDATKKQAVLEPLADNVVFNSRGVLAPYKQYALFNNDTFTIGDTTFQYLEN